MSKNFKTFYENLEKAFCTDSTACSDKDCNMLDGNLIYEGTQNIYQSYLPLGCQKLCIQILGKTGAASSSGTCTYLNVVLNSNLQSPSMIVLYTMFQSKNRLQNLIKSKADPATIFGNKIQRHPLKRNSPRNIY